MHPIIFDTLRFNTELAAKTDPIPLFRTALNEIGQTLLTQFKEHEEINGLVTRYTQAIDALLKRAWQYTLDDHADDLSLVAIGGYGRGELHPRSDIDLMVLGNEKTLEDTCEMIERFILFLWDIGLEVGHSVRTLNDCIEQSRADITVATNLMESRCLVGNHSLYDAMCRLTGPNHLWNGHEFFSAKLREQGVRHRKFHDSAYNLEPNVKEGPGGLRDIQVIGWVAKRHFGVNSFEELVEKGFLTTQELNAVTCGQSFLWRVRFGLHLLTQRREDRLHFDYQNALAEQLGYQDHAGHRAVEHFMKEYYLTIMELNRLNEMLLQLLQEEILYSNEAEVPTVINERFQVCHDFIEVRDKQVFKHEPAALLEIYLLLADHPDIKGVRANTIRLIREHLPLIDDAFRANPLHQELFIKLLRKPHGVTLALRRMHRYGVLGAYLPAFGAITGQMQHDLFHIYTVDEHTLWLIRNLHRFSIPEYHCEFPLCSQVVQSIPRPELLYIAGLFHDIAKGRGGNHSHLGAVDAEVFCQQHGFSEYDTDLVVWLIRNHLLMSITAQRKDISDPNVVNAFATQVEDLPRLDHLFLLTVADIRATNYTLWNGWKGALLTELYHATRKVLRRGLSNPIKEHEIIAEHKAEARRSLNRCGLRNHSIDTFWARLGNDYFLRYSAGEIAWHAQAVIAHPPKEPLLLIRQQTQRGGTEIFLYTPIRDYQFVTTTAALDRIGLNIVDARIIPSNDDYTLDTYIVLEEDGKSILSPLRITEIKQALQSIFTTDDRSEELPARRRMKRHMRHFAVMPRIHFHQDEENQYTVIEMVATDQPGLLSRLAACLAQCQVHLHTAKITTLGEQVEDIFFVTDANNRPLQEYPHKSCLRAAFHSALGYKQQQQAN